MQGLPKRRTVSLLLFCAFTSSILADPIAVKFLQGSTHGFVVLKTLEDKIIANGEVTQTVHGSEVTSRMILRFRDGSIDDDLTVFRQKNTFQLVRDHHVQKGPSFPKPTDIAIEAATGLVTSRAQDGKVTVQHMDLPADLSNGLPPNLLLNIPPSVPETKVSYLAYDDKPRLIHLSIKPTNETPFTVGGIKRKATDFTIHVELGGMAGIAAPILGKAPADDHIWIESGNPPAFVAEEGQLYFGGPIWRIEQVSPTFPRH